MIYPEEMDTDIGPFTLNSSISLPIKKSGESDDCNFRIPCRDDVIEAVLPPLIHRPSHDYAAAAGYGELLSDERASRDSWYDGELFRCRRGDFARALDAAEFYLDDTRESAGG